MSRSNWHIIIALGLILLPTLGQAQEKAQGEQGQAGAQQQPAQPFPVPLRVDVIEDEAAAEARKRREAETRQHEIDDLIAQQGMNAATQAMNEATQRMAVYSKWSTILVGIGTALLIITLGLTRQANRAAQAAVDVTGDIGMRQLRAYIVPQKCVIVEKSRLPRSLTTNITLANCGQTPAARVTAYAIQTITERPIGAVVAPVNENKLSRGTLGRDATTTLNAQGSSPSFMDRLEQLKAGKARLFVSGWVEYTDIFNKRWHRPFEFYSVRDRNSPETEWRMEPSTKIMDERLIEEKDEDE